MKKKQTSVLWTIVAFVVIAVGWYLKNKDKPLEESPTEEKVTQVVDAVEKSPRKPVTSSEADQMLKLARVADSKFTVLKNCTLDTGHRGNDGDSFMVKHPQGKTEFRLYFIDAPESKYKEYRDGNNNGKRLDDQGAYFGGLSRDHTAKVGTVAKKFVKKILTEQPFKVVTRWENVYGPDRKYAFVIVEHEGEPRYLHEILVAKGLGRIHTKGMTLPDSTSASRHKSHLRKVEAAAKSGKVGAWSIQ